jgi:hypothetical protein
MLTALLIALSLIAFLALLPLVYLTYAPFTAMERLHETLWLQGY